MTATRILYLVNYCGRVASISRIISEGRSTRDGRQERCGTVLCCFSIRLCLVMGSVCAQSRQAVVERLCLIGPHLWVIGVSVFHFGIVRMRFHGLFDGLALNAGVD